MADNKDNEKKPPANDYLRYSGLGFQIAGSILLGVLLGYYLDKWLNTKPYLLLTCSVTFLFAGMYLAFRDLLKNK